MNPEIKFNPKRVDESWKENVSKEKGETASRAVTSSPEFIRLITSLGMQALYALGLSEGSDQMQGEPDLEQAQQLIDMLVALREKTSGRLSPEESTLLARLISDIQLKFVRLQPRP